VTKLTYFLYNSIPGTHPSWTLAVLATGQADADRYVKNYNKGGKRNGKVTSGVVKASCGAVTPAAAVVMAMKNENSEGEFDD
jgi:hypothetical protein